VLEEVLQKAPRRMERYGEQIRRVLRRR
jgi:hypothetical protein